MLALSHDGAAAHRMREVLVERDELLTDDALALQALQNLEQLRLHEERLADVLAGLLEREQGAEAERALSSAPYALVSELVDAVPL